MSSDGPGLGTITSRPVLPSQPPVLGRWRYAFRAAGLAAGLGAVVALGPVLRPADGPPSLPLTVHAHVDRSGEVGLVSGGQMLSSAHVRPGPDGAARGAVEVVSQTWAPLAVRIRDTGPAIGLEDQVVVRVMLDDAVLFDGPRSQLRAADSDPGRLEPGQRGLLDITVSLTDGADAHQGRITDMTLTISSTPTEED